MACSCKLEYWLYILKNVSVRKCNELQFYTYFKLDEIQILLIKSLCRL